MEADCIVSNYFREVHDKKENEFINSILRECPFKGKTDALVYFINGLFDLYSVGEHISCEWLFSKYTRYFS